MAIHYTPSLPSFEFVNLNLIEVTSDNKVSFFGIILFLEVVDAKDLVTLLNSKVNVLTVVD